MINSQATQRYKFAPIEENGAFYFPTDNDCNYTVEVTNKYDRFNGNEILGNGKQVYEIMVTRGGCDDHELNNDPSVYVTIIHILASNIASKGDDAIFFYYCDNADNRGAERHRLFTKWFNEIKRQIPSLTLQPFQIPGHDGENYYISLVISENHFNKEQYISEFKKMLEDDYSK